MEANFRRIIPDENRFGTNFVFRAGSPLVPSDLRHVAASAAASVIVVADTSRYSSSLLCLYSDDLLHFLFVSAGIDFRCSSLESPAHTLNAKPPF